MFSCTNSRASGLQTYGRCGCKASHLHHLRTTQRWVASFKVYSVFSQYTGLQAQWTPRKSLKSRVIPAHHLPKVITNRATSSVIRQDLVPNHYTSLLIINLTSKKNDARWHGQHKGFQIIGAKHEGKFCMQHISRYLHKYSTCCVQCKIYLPGLNKQINPLHNSKV